MTLPLNQTLGSIPKLQISSAEPLARHARFGLGGPADWFVETGDPDAFAAALQAMRSSGEPYVVIGGGSNLIVADAGFRGTVLRYTGSGILREGNTVTVEAGADLQALVDFTITAGLRGVDTLTGIPGSVGGAVYGNAGAYGHSISERVVTVDFHDGAQLRTFSNADCGFRYRESEFKNHKEWIVFSATLQLDEADPEELRRSAGEIRKIRDEKYPPSMKCAGSIFKNCILTELPESVRAAVPARVIREGKVPSAYFLEEAGAKGIRRGDIQVAKYHANLIYNDGPAATAGDLMALIADLKERVRARFGLELEEEVQYIG